jgi:magnesium chelatase family protein
VLGLEATALDLWERAVAAGVLTARGGQKVLRVARTISDLAGQETVGTEAVAEALTYRWFDRSLEPEQPQPGGD